MEKSRCFIVDPVCGFDYGHNPHQLTYFRNYFEERDLTVVACCAFSYPQRAAVEAMFEPSFSYYYEEFIPLTDYEGLSVQQEREIRARLDELVSVEKKSLPADELEAIAIADWLNFFSKHQISAEDRIFHPSVDYYGAAGLLKALEIAFENNTPPMVHLRFIGVMENASKTISEPLRMLRYYLRRLSNSKNIELSAESSLYANYLSEYFGRKVSWSLFPLKEQALPINNDDEFVVYLGGAGREDKGFWRLLKIATRYKQLYRDDRVKFVTKRVGWNEEKWHAYEMSQMLAAPNIEVLPRILSSDRMLEEYKRCHLLIAPYDFETYRFRGSAMTQEGIVKARPMLLSSLTGFHDLGETLASVHNCAHDDEFCDKIHAYYMMDRTELYNEAKSTAVEFEGLSFGTLANVLALDEKHSTPNKTSNKATREEVMS
ncbi:MAG: glycosyltransferase [Henriciella sp.]|nr:glycosyltransferase [Henriciella sp.]